MSIVNYGRSKYHYDQEQHGAPTEFEQIADIKLLKAQMTVLAEDMMDLLNLNQAETAKLTHLSRQKVSDAINGHYNKISLNEIWQLVSLLSDALNKSGLSSNFEPISLSLNFKIGSGNAHKTLQADAALAL